MEPTTVSSRRWIAAAITVGIFVLLFALFGLPQKPAPAAKEEPQKKPGKFIDGLRKFFKRRDNP